MAGVGRLSGDVMGNGLLGEQHEEMLQLFHSLDPRLKRIIMSRAVEILEVTGDIRAAVQVLLRYGAKQIRGR
jgi:hypothetical protein